MFDYPFYRLFSVPLTDFSYEVLCDVVKYIYYGEAVVRNEVKAQFGNALEKLNIVGPLCNLDDSESDEESDGEGYKELVRDNDDSEYWKTTHVRSIRFKHTYLFVFYSFFFKDLLGCDQKIRRRHKRPEGKMPYVCETAGCKVNFFTKVVDGKTMIKVVHAVHSPKCEKQRKQRTTPQNEWSDLLRHMVGTKGDTSKKSSAEKGSNASGSGATKKLPKKAAKKDAE